MKRLTLSLCLVACAALPLGCEQKSSTAPIHMVDRSPILGAWYMQQNEGDSAPTAGDVSFEFKPFGCGTYERSARGDQPGTQCELVYNLADDIISITGPADVSDAPRITGQIELAEDKRTLRITTHTGEHWLLSRDHKHKAHVVTNSAPDQSSEAPVQVAAVDPEVAHMQQLILACNLYVEQQGNKPSHVVDLLNAGLVTPEQLTASGDRSDLPRRFDRMTDTERKQWFDANGAYVFFLEYAGTRQSSSVLVAAIPKGGDTQVMIGMADGAAHLRPVDKASQLIELQMGELPTRWPAGVARRSIFADVMPIGD